MRDKLIELISSVEYGYSGSKIGKNFQRGFIERIADHLIANGVTLQQWIPVSERLPTDSKAVLVYAPRNRNIFECFHRSDGYWEIASYTFGILHDDVTHWMPLPEMPKEGV